MRVGEESTAECVCLGQVVAAVAEGGQFREVVIGVHRHRFVSRRKSGASDIESP